MSLCFRTPKKPKKPSGKGSGEEEEEEGDEEEERFASLSTTILRPIVPAKLEVTEALRARWDTGAHKIWRV